VKEDDFRRPIKTNKLIPFPNLTLLLATHTAHETVQFSVVDTCIHGACETDVADNVTIAGQEEKVGRVGERLTHGVVDVKQLAACKFLQQLARALCSSS
jgi:hypothetical protein